MPVKAGERLDPEATRARILAAAAEVFTRRGIHAAGISEVVEAVLTDRTQRVRAWHNQAVEQADPGRDRVLAVFDLVASWYAEAGFRGCAMMNAATEDRGQDGAPRRLAQDHLTFYRDLFSRLLKEAGARDPETTARQLVVVLEGATLISAVDRDPGLGAEARVIVETLLDAAL